jgi:hypothetical protein
MTERAPEPADTKLALVLNEKGEPEAVYIRDDERAAESGSPDPEERWFLIDPYRSGDDYGPEFPLTWRNITRNDGSTVVELTRVPALVG